MYSINAIVKGVREYILVRGRKVPVVQVGSQNRIVLPKDILEEVGEKRFVVVCENGKIILIPERVVLEEGEV